MKKNNRVYGVVGIKSKMSMWNADMTGAPKTTANDIIYGSDKALKYAIKNLWKLQGDKVLYIKHRDENYDLLNLAEIYEREFNVTLPDKKDKDGNKKVITNILNCSDVRQFGATFAVGNTNIGLTGVVQIGQGLNKWEDSNRLVIDILSPFVNSKKEGDMTSIGSKNVVDEAHYFYPIAINPRNYDDLIKVVDDYDGYTEEDYEKLKKALLVCATALDTNSKANCENEFALFINCKEDSDLFLSNLDEYIDISMDYVIDISRLQKYLKSRMDSIDSIEVFYNDNKLSLVFQEDDKIIIKNMYNEIL